MNNRGRRFVKIQALSLTRWLCAIAAIIPTVGAMADEAFEEGDPAKGILIRGVAVYGRGEAETLDRGAVLVRNGRIIAVGPDLQAPDGGLVIDVEGGSVTPGLIDANALIEPGDMIAREEEASQPSLMGGALSAYASHNHSESQDHQSSEYATGERLLNPWEVGATIDACQLAAAASSGDEVILCPVCGGVVENPPNVSGVGNPRGSHVEGSSEVVPHTYVLDSLNLASPDFDRLLREGVTTVYTTPDNAAVIGPRGAIVRTGGPVHNRVIRESADVTITMGTDTYRIGGGNSSPRRGYVSSRTRRPNSRMGVAWVLRKAFYDLEKYLDGERVTGAEAPPLDAMDSLNAIRQGELPLRVRARLARDIETMYRIVDELGLPNFTLIEATEAYRVIELLRERGTPVVFGPIYIEPNGVRSISDETRESRLFTMRELLNAGVPTALSANDLREEDGLARQAMYALRAGVSFEDALQAVTLTPAKMLGLADELGTIETGKRADLVVWNGEPFAATSRPLIVLHGGEVAYDARAR